MSREPDVPTRLSELALVDPFGEALGVRHETLGDGHVVSRLRLHPEHRNPFGVSHGSVVFALADTGMGRALSTSLPADARCATLTATIQFLEAAHGAGLVAESTVLHLGEKVAVIQCEVSSDDGTRCAVANATFYVSRPAAAR
jgi:acyl-CoA thioesterase